MSDPKELLYSKSHEWVRVEGSEAVVGITHYAQESLGDITYVEVPAEGDEVAAEKEFGTVESVKAASDLISPVSGKIVAVNPALENTPEVINQDPYGKGWIIKVALSAAPAGLLDAAAYGEFCKTESH